MASELELRFEEALLDICRRSENEAGYKATGFLQKFHRVGGLRTAQELIAEERVTKGYIAMWERKRLDLSIEALILAPEWHDLFTHEERRIATDRLHKYGYQPK